MKKHFLWALALALLLTAITSVGFAQEVVVDFENGENVFVQSGSCSPAIVSEGAHGGTNALLVSQRTTNNWDSVDFPYDLAGLKAGDTVQVAFWALQKGSEKGQIVVGNGGGNYATLIAADVEPNVWTFIEGEFVVGEEPINLRFQTDATLIGVDYMLDDITFTVFDTTVEKTVAADFDFEGEEHSFIQSGSCNIAIEEGALVVSQRTTNDWDAADLSFEELGLQAGDTVRVSFWAMQKGSDVGKIQVANGGGNWATLVEADVQPNEWTRIAGEFVVGETPVNIRFKTDAALIGVDYCIDNLKIEIIRPAVTTYHYAFDLEDNVDPGFIQSGSCTLTVADGVLTVSQRTTNNWDAVDMGRADLKITAGDTVKVSFDVYHEGEAAGVAALAEGGGSYADLITAEVEPKTWTTVAGEFVMSEKEPNLRFKLDDSLIGVDYKIDNIVIDVVKPYLVKTYSYDVENGLGTEEAPIFIQSGNCSMIVSDKANSGVASVGCEQRTTNDWDAIDLSLEAAGLAAGDHVKISFYLYADTDAETEWGVGEGGGSWATLVSQTVPGKTWTKIEGEFDISEKAPNLRFKSMSDAGIGVNYYVDDIDIEFYAIPADPDADIITAVAYGPSAEDFDSADKQEMANGSTFQAIWDGKAVYVKAFVADTTNDKADCVSVFVDGMNKKVKRAKGEEVEGGYIVTIKNICPAEAGQKFKFDVVTMDASGDACSWAGSEVIDSTEAHAFGRILMGPVAE